MSRLKLNSCKQYLKSKKKNIRRTLEACSQSADGPTRNWNDYTSLYILKITVQGQQTIGPCLFLYGPVVIWACFYIGLLLYGPVVIWVFCYMGLSLYGHFVIWDCRFIWTCCYMGILLYIWACRYMGLLLYGPVVVWAWCCMGLLWFRHKTKCPNYPYCLSR
jgi:hypothetical protein